MTRILEFAGLILGATLVCLGGCGGPAPPATEPPPENVALQEIGQMYSSYIDEFKRPPRAGKDLMRYAPAFSHGSMAIQNQDVVLFGGINLEPGATAVLAYQKVVPKTGGMVLLQDGETVKAMTAQEFQVASKAGK